MGLLSCSCITGMDLAWGDPQLSGVQSAFPRAPATCPPSSRTIQPLIEKSSTDTFHCCYRLALQPVSVKAPTRHKLFSSGRLTFLSPVPCWILSSFPQRNRKSQRSCSLLVALHLGYFASHQAAVCLPAGVRRQRQMFLQVMEATASDFISIAFSFFTRTLSNL